MIFKNEGEEVKTVSKFFITVLIPVTAARIKADIQILWSPNFGHVFFYF